jgi:oligoendopeptidase F
MAKKLKRKPAASKTAATTAKSGGRAQPRVGKTKPKAVKAKSKVVQAKPKVVQAKPVVKAKIKAKSKLVAPKGEVLRKGEVARKNVVARKSVTVRKPVAVVAPKRVTRPVVQRAARAMLLPARSAVAAADTWDLTPLFATLAAWEAAYGQATSDLGRYESYKGRLGESAAVLREFLDFDIEYSRLVDRVGNFSSLRASEDQGAAEAQKLRAKYQHLATRVSEASSFFRPELLSLPQETLEWYLNAPELTEYRTWLERIIRYRAHTLGPAEEKLLAMQGQMSAAPSLIFRQLNDADLKFGTLADEQGREVELSHSTFSSFLHSPDADVRGRAFRQYYAQFNAHKNTIAAALSSSVHRDIYYARARNHPTAREAALFPDNVPTSVYDNLVATVRKHLPTNQRYLEIRRRAMKLKELHFYDTYVPMVPGMRKVHTWPQAVEVLDAALAPLGQEYVTVLKRGLTVDRWSDRYPNSGKQSGAYSSGVYDSPPYIMMNFREEVLEHVFTLAHEAGHSMHTWHTNRHQPYQYSDYAIFVAEVASTFNEELLAEHLMRNATSKEERAYLINRQIDGIRATIIRQTMFAEFERDVHAVAEAGEPLTLAAFRSIYRKLLDTYHAPAIVIDDDLELECLRIPHFYSAFYVYKYATGLAAAIALSRGVLSGSEGALDRYLGFLKAGASKYPLEVLRDAGVDMETPAPLDAAFARFAELVDQLDELV